MTTSPQIKIGSPLLKLGKSADAKPLPRRPDEKVAWIDSVPFFLMHLLPLGALFTGVRLFDVALCIALYYGRMFFITGAYHRYFAHRSYKTSRVFQFLLAFGGATAAQKGPLWWAGYHRHHHRYSDQPDDIHSPKRGFWWSHCLWILCPRYTSTPFHEIKDMARYPELVWLNRFHLVPPILLGAAVYLLWGASALFTGFFLSTILLYHGTFFVNSLAHVFGWRRFETTDTSRNSWWVALITMGEGWNNNHHHYPASTRQGFYWWEIDMSYYVLRAFQAVGLVWDIKEPGPEVLERHRIPGSR